MSDLISRQAAIKAIHEEFDDCLVWDESGQQTADEMENILSSLPSADAVEVVRCKGCKWYFTQDLEMAKLHGAECVIRPRRMMPEDYCSYGERADGQKV